MAALSDPDRSVHQHPRRPDRRQSDPASSTRPRAHRSCRRRPGPSGTGGPRPFDRRSSLRVPRPGAALRHRSAPCQSPSERTDAFPACPSTKERSGICRCSAPDPLRNTWPVPFDAKIEQSRDDPHVVLTRLGAQAVLIATKHFVRLLRHDRIHQRHNEIRHAGNPSVKPARLTGRPPRIDWCSASVAGDLGFADHVPQVSPGSLPEFRRYLRVEVILVAQARSGRRSDDVRTARPSLRRRSRSPTICSTTPITSAVLPAT